MMKVLDKHQLEQMVSAPDASFACFLYTPLCGTCKLAQRMLEIVLEIRPDLPLYRCNINEIPDFAREYRVESIPCLMVWQKGKLIRQEYALGSVDRLYDWLKPLPDIREKEG